MTNAYQNAGVDVKVGYEVVDRIKKQIAKTKRPGMLSEIGGFGGMFDLSLLNYREPVLVSGTDGVGTKLMVAFEADKHDTIGIDCVAMCVNDVVAQGATPLYFLDYLAAGQTEPQKIEAIVSGVVKGCQASNMALIGGETAEMPGMYATSHYDMAGFAVGVAERSEIVTGQNIQDEDVLIGLASSGIHSNGYSLVRKIFFEQNNFTVQSQLPEFPKQALGDVLLTPTRIYVEDLLTLFSEKVVHGAAHITGGGFVENIPRMLPKELMASIQLGSWPVLPIFEALKKYGQLNEKEMYEIFNMGIGMVLAVAPTDVEYVLGRLNEKEMQAFEIGHVLRCNKNQTIELKEA